MSVVKDCFPPPGCRDPLLCPPHMFSVVLFPCRPLPCLCQNELFREVAEHSNPIFQSPTKVDCLLVPHTRSVPTESRNRVYPAEGSHGILWPQLRAFIWHCGIGVREGAQKREPCSYGRRWAGMHEACLNLLFHSDLYNEQRDSLRHLYAGMQRVLGFVFDRC